MSDLFGLVGTALGGLFGLGSNVMNAASQANANRWNWRINQANINAAKAMYDRQEAFQREMYARQLEYNDPSAQRERIARAGVNPWTTDFGVGGASSPSAPSYSQPSQIPMQATHFTPIMTPAEGMQIGMSVGQLGLLEAEKDKTQAEASSAWTDANFKRQQNLLAVAKGISEIHGISASTKSTMIDNYIKQNTAEYAIQSSKYDTDYKYQQIRSTSLDIKAKELGLPFIAPTHQAIIDNYAMDTLLKKAQIKSEGKKPALMAAQIYSLIESGKLSAEQAKKAYEEALKINRERLNMPALSPEKVKELGELMFESAINSAMISGAEADKAEDYLTAPDAYKEFNNFLERTAKAVLPFK